MTAGTQRRIAVVGAGAWGTALAQTLSLAGHSVLSHANVAVPPRVDRVLSWFIVTPDMHRVHHASAAEDYDSNYGQVFPYWDRLCRTLRAKPVELQAKMSLGLGIGAPGADLNALQLTLLPLQNSQYPATFANPAAIAPKPGKQRGRGAGRK